MKLPKALSCTERLVLLFVATNGEAEYSVTSLADSLGSSRKAVHAALRHLTTLGMILTLEHPRGRRGGIYKAALQNLEPSP